MAKNVVSNVGPQGPTGPSGPTGPLGPTGAASYSAVGVGAYASRPAAGNAGAVYYPTDGWCSYVDDGNAWRPIIGGVAGNEPPSAVGFTPSNMSATSTLVSNNGVLIASDSTPTNAVPNYRIWYRSMTSGTGVEACVMHAPTMSGPGNGLDGVNMNFTFGGILLRESSSGKLAAFMMFHYPNASYNAITFSCEYATSTTSGRQVPGGGSKINLMIGAHLYLRMRSTGGTFYYEYSTGRGQWFLISSVSSTTVFTSGLPDQYGLVVWPYSSNNNNPSSSRVIIPHITTF